MVRGEIITSSAEQENHLRRILREDAKYFMRDVMPASEHVEFKSILDDIDYQSLREVMEEMFRKSVEERVPDDFNFLGPDSVYAGLEDNSKNYNSQSYGYYSGRVNLIALNYSAIENKVCEKTKDKDSEESVKALVVYTLIHEMIHALSRQTHIFSGVDTYNSETGACNYYNNETVEVGGYRITHDIENSNNDKSSLKNYFETVNEAVTEKIAYEVFMEYNRRTQHFGKEEIKMANEADNIKESKKVELLEDFMEVVAKDKGLDVKVVWEAVKRGYFEGISGKVKWREEIDEIFGEGWYEKFFLKNF